MRRIVYRDEVRSGECGSRHLELQAPMRLPGKSRVSFVLPFLGLFLEHVRAWRLRKYVYVFKTVQPYSSPTRDNYRFAF